MAIPNPEFINEVLRLTNEFRAQRGLNPLKINEELNYAAQRYSEELAVRDVGLDHNLDGFNWTDRARAVGYEAENALTGVSENLWSFSEEPTLELAAKAVADWIDSDGHRVQLENPAFTEMGLGVGYRADNNPGPTPDSPDQDTYWTQMFGTGDINPETKVPGGEPPVVPPPPTPKGDYQAMLDALGARESGLPNGDPGQYTVENDFGFMGKYQFGEALLIDLGYYQDDSYYPDNKRPKNEWDGTWTGKNGVSSKADFLNSPTAQEAAIRAAFDLNLERLNGVLEGKSVNDYIGKEMTFEGETITISLSGLLAGAHLRGPNAVADLLLRGRVDVDETNTKITTYVNEFGGYTVTLEEVENPVEEPPVEEPPVEEPPVEEPPVEEPPVEEPPVEEPPVEEPPVEEPPVEEPPIEDSPLPTEGDDVLVSNNAQGDSLFGLGGNDRITGGLGNDTLDGGAGNDALNGLAGDDVMKGGLGDDSYTVDSGTDVVTEAINEGTDTVFASTSYTLSDNVENLTLTGNSAVNGTGNSLDNILVGNTEANYLYAGDGADQVNGEAGDDYLYGQSGDDLLNGGEGIDWLVGDLGDDVISGGAGNDRLLGGLGNDTLIGGPGKDRLTGGADADRFVLNALDKPFDIITDFKATQGDKIIFSAAGVGAMKRGKLHADRFTLGSTAEHEEAGFVYDKPSGRLFFDADGLGGQKQVLIAKLTAGTTLTAANIFVTA